MCKMTRIDALEYVDITGRKYTAVKRALDVVCAALLLAALALPFAVIALLVFGEDGGRVLFCQKRVGRFGREFNMYKIRTLKRTAPPYLPSRQQERSEVTRVGRVLRRLSLDELPQLVNVLKGEMSIVGPRPLIAGEREIHELRARYGVYNARPGLTGLAQINGRDELPPLEKTLWDVTYLKRYGFWTDVKILLGTVPQLFGGKPS